MYRSYLLVGVPSFLALFAEGPVEDLNVGSRDFDTMSMFYLTASWSEGTLAQRMIWGRVSGRAMSIRNLFLLSSAEKSVLRSLGTLLSRVRGLKSLRYLVVDWL
ncbi:hypothetical protein PoB_002150400 [Plakobranchus ocellatus]|uniref:Uncharacterized protein n=1 Tax=Plakobranchus ocellatus TaxID=259542 RepID=A0AAV3ZKU9_9GAST|nr:hypothetical protein PoB_002150400 [Plakobranchus ocellatus]